MVTIKDIKGRKTYKEMDDEGRLKFQGYCMAFQWCKFKRKSKDDKSIWDVSYLTSNTPTIGEIKDRKFNSNKYPSAMIEVKKLKALQELNLVVDGIIHYINIYDDNVVRIFDITDIDLDNEEIKTEMLPSNTAEDGDLIEKQVIYLDNNRALKL
jgi:hypothetical protein